MLGQCWEGRAKSMKIKEGVLTYEVSTQGLSACRPEDLRAAVPTISFLLRRLWVHAIGLPTDLMWDVLHAACDAIFVPGELRSVMPASSKQQCRAPRGTRRVMPRGTARRHFSLGSARNRRSDGLGSYWNGWSSLFHVRFILCDSSSPHPPAR
jgi:hypothetical protein